MRTQITITQRVASENHRRVCPKPSELRVSLGEMSLLHRSVFALGWVSFLTDLSAEMIYPLLPTFLATVLGATAMQLGIIEGIAETISALLKWFSGAWADRLKHRKPLILLGYALSSISRPLVGFASSWTQVLGIRMSDRVGKGIRSSPRDALIADVTPEELRGRAYGFHQAMDHAGAVAGPLLAMVLLTQAHLPLRTIFLLASIPAAITILVLIFGVTEAEIPKATEKKFSIRQLIRDSKTLPSQFNWLLLSVFIFTLGCSTDAFLLLKLSSVGIGTESIAFLWAIHHVVRMSANFYGGRLSDRIGERKMILFGWLWYGLIYLLFALVQSQAALIAVFLLYGVHFGWVEPSEKSWVSKQVLTSQRGTAFGTYNFVVGISSLPASIFFGWVWTRFGAPAAFTTGAVFSAFACLILWIKIPNSRSTPAV